MIVQLTFWEWAQRRGYSVNQLAEKLGFSPEHISRLKNRRLPITVDFVARCVLAFGDEVRPFFSPEVAIGSDRIPVTTYAVDRKE